MPCIPFPSNHRLIRRLVALTTLPPLLLTACTTGPEQAAEDAASASAHDTEANEGIKIRVESRYLLLAENDLQAVFGELEDHAVEIEAPDDGNAPTEAYLLSAAQTDLLTRSTRANRTSTSLAAPRLTVSPGESGQLRLTNKTDHEDPRPPHEEARPGSRPKQAGRRPAEPGSRIPARS